MMIRASSRGHWSSPDHRSASLEICLDYEKKEVGFDLVISGYEKYERTHIKSFAEALDKFDKASAWVDGRIEELEKDEPDDFDPFAERFELVYDIMGHLRDNGMERFWSDGEEILCKNEDECEAVANFIDAIIGDSVTHIGYYDPKDDDRSREVDDHTGYWYIDWD